jgi:hypothetical protein
MEGKDVAVNPQAPIPKTQRSSKPQSSRKPRLAIEAWVFFGAWGLVLEDSLVLGDWCLEFLFGGFHLPAIA